MAWPTTTWHLSVFILWHQVLPGPPHEHGYGNCRWSMGNYPVATPLKTMISPFSRCHKQSNSQWFLGREKQGLTAPSPLMSGCCHVQTHADSLQAMAAVVNSWLPHPCQALEVRLYNTRLYHLARTFFLPTFLQCSPSLRRWETYIPLQAGDSIVI